MARLLVTVLDAFVRDGDEAVRLAQEAVRLDEDTPRLTKRIDRGMYVAGRFGAVMLLVIVLTL